MTHQVQFNYYLVIKLSIYLIDCELVNKKLQEICFKKLFLYRVNDGKMYEQILL